MAAETLNVGIGNRAVGGMEPTLSTTILTLVPSVITLLRETSLYSFFTTPVRTKCPQCVLTARELQTSYNEHVKASEMDNIIYHWLELLTVVTEHARLIHLLLGLGALH
jgi:hypothetical protein